MIKDSKDFNEQLNILKQGIKIPQLDVSKVMNSVEFNEYLNNIQIALNDLTQSTVPIIVLSRSRTSLS